MVRVMSESPLPAPRDESDEPRRSVGVFVWSIRSPKESHMSRTRVHNLNISIDGYAAGEYVTLDAPIGGAERLFSGFDGRAIHGIDRVDAPITVDRALTTLWGQGVGAEIMGRRKFGPTRAIGPTTGGAAGGVTSHRSRHRSSS